MSSLIAKDEFEDYKTILSDHGYTENDFELTEQANQIPAGEIHPVTGEVTIKYKKTGVQQSYRAGHVSHWVVDFEEDLKVGVFKKQQKEPKE